MSRSLVFFAGYFLRLVVSDFLRIFFISVSLESCFQKSRARILKRPSQHLGQSWIYHSQPLLLFLEEKLALYQLWNSILRFRSITDLSPCSLPYIFSWPSFHMYENKGTVIVPSYPIRICTFLMFSVPFGFALYLLSVYSY